MAEQMGAFDENAIEILKLFIEMTASQIEELKAAQEAQDLKSVMEIGHSLKGAALSACLKDLGAVAAKIQDDAEAGKDCTDLVAKAEAEFIRARDEINTL